MTPSICGQMAEVASTGSACFSLACHESRWQASSHTYYKRASAQRHRIEDGVELEWARISHEG
jgi:hypothetical protein